MDERDHLLNIESSDQSVRAYAAFRLRDSFDEHIGDRLVQMLITERAEKPFRVMCMAVIPKWIVKLERMLSTMDEWPFEPVRTAYLIQAVKGFRFPPIERRILEFLSNVDWGVRLATVGYCHDGMVFAEVATLVCSQFQLQYIASPDEKRLLVRVMGFDTFRQLAADIRRKAKDFTPDPSDIEPSLTGTL